MAKPLLQRLTKRFFIICNIVAAACFILGSYVKFFDPVRWWFFGLFTLSLPYILFTLIIFLICWLLSKKIWMLISLLTIAFCWEAVRNIFPFRLSSSFKIEKNSNDLRVMSWNVAHFVILEHKTHPEIKQQMLALINQYQPDVACFQEMVGGDFNKAINYLGDFKKILNFSDYYYSYNYKLDFDQDHHFGIIIFSRYPFANKQTISSNPNNYNSIFQYVDIVVNEDTVRVFNIHLQSLKFTQTNMRYLENPEANSDTVLYESRNIVSKLKLGFLKRKVQAQRIKEEMQKSPYPIILCGDFNDVPNSYAYGEIGDDLQNAFVQKGAGFGRTYSGISPTLRIDNIFADKRFTVDQYKRVPKLLSDHFPIIADINLHMSK